jgi:outer membrane protein assembly factor BamB
VSLEHTCPDGNLLCHDASYEGSLFSNLTLQSPLPPGESGVVKDAARDFLRRRGQNAAKPNSVWRDQGNRRFTSFIVSANQVLATGHAERTPDAAFLWAINVKDGTDAWSHPLPSQPVKGGTAIDGTGRVYVALENGQLHCFAPAR